MRKTTRRKGGRRKASAAVRRKPTRHVRSHNPPARRAGPRRRHHNLKLFARRRIHRVRRRNPGRVDGGLLAKGFILALSAAGVQFVVSFVPPIGGISAPADAIRTLAIGWLASVGMKKSGFLARYGDDVFLAGATLAGGKVISSLLLPWALRLFPQRAPAPAPMQAAEGATMAGLATLYPGQQLFSRYRPGMQGLATWYPGQQPYSQWYTAGGGVPIA